MTDDPIRTLREALSDTGIMSQDALASLEQVERLRDVANAIAEVMLLASTPGFMWRRMRELGPELDAALSPFYPTLEPFGTTDSPATEQSDVPPGGYIDPLPADIADGLEPA
jgi:hypothetical protein